MNKHYFESKDALDLQLAQSIADRLSEAIQLRGQGTVLFSGGSTPKGLFRALGKLPVEWEKINIGLVDERMVATDSQYLNANLIATEFLQHISGQAPTFYPLAITYDSPEENMQLATQAINKMGVLDVVVLGMGSDGHFASLFPNDLASEKGLSPEFEAPLLYTNAPAEPKDRISHSWSFLREAKYVVLHITGQEKLSLLEAAKERQIALPIDATLVDANHCPTLYWAP